MITGRRRDALLLARSRILYRQDTLICLALDHYKANDKSLTRSVINILKKDIRRAIYPSGTLGAWQFRNGRGRRSMTQQRLDRLAWIDWMLENWE